MRCLLLGAEWKASTHVAKAQSLRFRASDLGIDAECVKEGRMARNYGRSNINAHAVLTATSVPETAAQLQLNCSSGPEEPSHIQQPWILPGAIVNKLLDTSFNMDNRSLKLSHSVFNLFHP
jgi:hypothetical protein